MEQSAERGLLRRMERGNLDDNSSTYANGVVWVFALGVACILALEDLR